MVTTAAILIIVACAKHLERQLHYIEFQDISYFISSTIDTKALFMMYY